MSHNYRDDFPLIKNNDTIYIDNAATSQKPECVIKAEAEFYEKNNANPLRGFYPALQQLRNTKIQEKL